MRAWLCGSALLLLAVAHPASAGDFTGAYVGVNAGWAAGHSRESGTAFLPGRTEDDRSLPPSAASAAGSLQGLRGEEPRRGSARTR